MTNQPTATKYKFKPSEWVLYRKAGPVQIIGLVQNFIDKAGGPNVPAYQVSVNGKTRVVAEKQLSVLSKKKER